MSKALIISDLHNRWKIGETIIDRHKDEVDKIIFLGDLLDSFTETQTDIENTLNWFKKQLQDDKFIWCQGNHDSFYIYPQSGYLKCSGNTAEKGKLFRQVLGEDARKSKLYHFDDYFLYSHAGLSPYFLPPQGFSLEWLEKTCETAIKNAEGGIFDPFLYAGFARGANQVVGGINWLDWELEFEPIEGLNQVVGHSIGKTVRRKIGNNSVNYNIDTNSRHYAIVTDGKVEIYNQDGSRCFDIL